MFQKHEIEKHYEAWVEGDFSVYLQDDNQGDEHVANDSVKIITTKIDNKTAESHLRLLKTTQDNQGQTLSLLDVEIKTGRKHQIRKHLAEIGYPIVGDRLYGSGKSDKNLQLSAVLLRFNYPDMATQEEIQRCYRL